jgi:transposase
MNDIHNGRSERKTAKKFGVSRQWIQQLKRQEKQTGAFEAKPLKGVVDAKRKLKPFQEQLKKYVAEHPDATQNELAAMMKKFVKVSGSMIGRELKIPGFTYKKVL